jgi:AI-2 transport protein TqsA
MALSFGVLAFLLNFIPNVGPIVASLLPIPLILLDPSGNIVWMVAVIAATATIQLISGNVVEPKLMGNSSDLHPVTILLALMFWGMMWGIIGMFLATPITAAIKIVLERFELTRPIASVMAGRFEERQPEDDSQTAQLASP